MELSAAAVAPFPSDAGGSQGGNPKQMQSALRAGLAQAEDILPARGDNQPGATAPAAEPALLPALIVDKPLRSGQQVYARGP